MKLCIIFILFFSFGVSARVTAQQEKVSLNLSGATLKTLFQEIQKQTGLNFVYNEEICRDFGNVSVRVRDETVENIMKKVFEGRNLTYMFEDGIIVVKVLSERAQVAESVRVTGKVTDTGGTPLPGVSIVIKGTSLGVTSDVAGNFQITLPKGGNEILVFSFVGMKMKEVDVRGKEKLNVVLEELVENLQEAVVTGIYTRSKESFTGSAATYTAKDLKMIGTQNILQSLKTLDPAMLMIESKAWGSDPNRLPDIEIRGKTSLVGLKSDYEYDPNQPLFILDGVETNLETIINLNMDRVASVTILKDAASTAIYGSKAANGVIVVETVQPEAGQLRVSYSGNFGLQFADLSDYNLMDATEKLEFERLSGKYKATDDFYGSQVELDVKYNNRLKEILRGVDTYWLSEPLRTVFNHRHNVYAEGGDNAMRYGIGLGYNNSDGVMEGSDRDVISGNIDLTYRKGKLLFSNKFSMDVTNSEREPVAFSEFARANPYNRKRTESGEIPMYLEGPEQSTDAFINPLYKFNIKNTNTTNTLSLRDNFNVEWRILESLRARGRFGVNKTVTKNERFKSPKHPEFREKDQLKRGSFQSNMDEAFSYNGDLNISYGKLFAGRHQLNAVGGMSFSQNNSSSSGYEVVGFNSEFHTNPAFSTGFTDGQKPIYTKIRSRAASFFMNANYSYANRYLLDLNLRSDGTSKFGLNKRFSTTWAVGLGWNIHNESFVKEWGIFDNLKVRASIGNPGNQNFDAYQAMKTYRYNVQLQNMFGTSAIIDKFGNKNLDWQRTIDKNIGLDVAILDNRVRLAVDYYYKDTDPLLVSIGMPPSVGVSSIYTNFGRQVSSGWNGSVAYTPIKRKDFNWTVNVNFRTSKSEYREIGDQLDYLNEKGSSRTLVRYYDGASPDDMWAVPSLGIDPATGYEVFLKKNGEQTFVYSADDEVVVGCSTPDVEGVVGTSVYYKGFSASLNFRYRLGGQEMASALYNKVENIAEDDVFRNQDKRALYDRWQRPGDHAKFKSVADQSSTPMSSRFVVTENTFSGESISVGYESTGKWLQYIGAQGMTVRAYMNEIFRISSFKEERGIEYPFARNVSLSLSLRF